LHSTRLLLAVVEAAKAWARARQGKDRRVRSDAEARLLRAVQALEAGAGGGRRGRFGW
jgi:hypothetical protein